MMNTWRTKIVTCASVLVGLIFLIGPILGSALTASAQSTDAWQIDSFDANILVEEDATLLVQEKISVDFNEYRHGIFRDIPYVYRDKLGNRVKIDLTIEQVLQDGAPATFTADRSGGFLSLKIGSPNREIDGQHDYQIDYTVKRALLYFDDHDELYWNVTGSDWEVPVRHASAVITLPDDTMINLTDCYVGGYGSESQQCGVAINGSSVAFAADDFLTVNVAFPKGVVAEPSMIEQALIFLADNWLAIFPLIFIVVVVGLWLKLGRDPKHGVVIAEYQPPKRVWAVYAGSFERGALSKQDLVAMIVQMAVNGYLKIVQSESESAILKIKQRETTLIKLKTSTDLDEAHRLLFEAIFEGRSEVRLSDLNGKMKAADLQAVHAAANRWLIDHHYYSKHSFVLRFAFFVAAGFIFFIGIMLGSDFGLVTGAMFTIAALVTAIFGQFMPRRTLSGAEMLRQIKGFRLFLHNAERYRAAWQEKEGLFFDFLPYAIAFNDVKHWATVFSGIEQSYPEWYQGTGTQFMVMNFADDLGRFSSLFGAAMTPPSPKSGTGGGGFSGGGFGGGGGGRGSLMI
jgi:uncharacterized membrane protein